MTPSEKDEHTMNVHKRNLWITAVLAVFLLTAFVISPAAADDVTSPGSLFSIPGKTTIVSPTDSTKSSTLSLQDYGPLNIPSALLAPSSSLRAASLSSPAYQLATFDNVIPMRSNTITLPITLYGQTYTIPLTKATFETIDDGIDSYQGTVPGIDGSVVLITVAPNNLIQGSIILPDDSIEIYPVQNRAYAATTEYPIHIIYSENSFPQTDGPLPEFGSSRLISDNLLNQIPASSFTITRGNPEDTAIIGVLVTTDNEFKNSVANWRLSAQNCINAVDYQFSGPSIKASIAICAYDDTKASQFSASSLKRSDPLALLHSLYPHTALRNNNANLAVYFGGNDYTGSRPTLIADGYLEERYSWIQMVADSNVPESGRPHSQKYGALHSLGANFNALEGLAAISSSGGVTTYTAMHPYYYGSTGNTGTIGKQSLLAYSSSNAARIKAYKFDVQNNLL